MKRLLRHYACDIAILALLFFLPLIAFWSQTVGGRTLLPAENLYQYEPYASYRDQTGAEQPPPDIPQNHLLSDLVLQNYQWKSFILDNLRQGEIPLWNPHQFSGIPFLAAGQHSALYPFNLLYYILPLPGAYGWFTVSQLFLAGAFMFAFLRGIGIGRLGAAAGGVIFQLSAFFVISAVFPMIIAAAAWLPLILLMIEFIIRRRALLRGVRGAAPWVVIGAVALGCVVLAGHVEILYYTLIIAGYYAACRLGWELWRVWRRSRVSNPSVGARQASPELLAGEACLAPTQTKSDSPFHEGEGLGVSAVFISVAWLLAMVALGIALGGVQFLPLLELANINFRSGSASLEQVRGWAHPFRDLLLFLMPNFYGNPAHHSYLDVFSRQNVSLIENVVTNAAGGRIIHTEWGLKNYVEGALYVGILPLALAVYGLIARRFEPPGRQERQENNEVKPIPPYRPIFAVLGLFSLTFMFGLPTYALLYYVLPGVDQLHSPFRWVFGLTLSVAVLAGFGLDALAKKIAPPGRQVRQERAFNRRLARIFGIVLLVVGIVVLAGLFASRLFYPQIEPMISRVFVGMALAEQAFSNAAMFYSYQFTNVLIFGVMLVGSSVVFLWGARRDVSVRAQHAAPLRRDTIFAAFTLTLIAADLLIASWGFNPSSDAAWLEYQPPALAWLQAQQRDGDDWRYITLDDPSQRPLFNANMTMRYGLDDARGYESIIPLQTVEFMNRLSPPVQLDYNRIAPLYSTYSSGFDPQSALTSPLLDALNIRYVVTHRSTDLSDTDGFTLAYSDNAVNIWENTQAFPRAMLVPLARDGVTAGAPVQRIGGSSRERIYTVGIDQPSLLVISETNLPGWRAYLRPVDGTDDDETPLNIRLVNGNFIGVELPDTGAYIVRVVYSPQSFQIGIFMSFISFIILMLIGGSYVWRVVISEGGEGGTSLNRIARNSVAPILLNLFNRGIDFAFAFIMLRLLGPEQAGSYFYAGVIFVWFDIFTNFGLNLYVIREVSRDHSKARLYLLNTSAMRIGLAFVGVPLLMAFLGLRQNTVTPPLDPATLAAIGLLYIGLIPGSLSNGFTALFYAFERAELPAAVATIATICKTVGGLIALLVGWGIVGLAAVSIITNCLTLIVLWWNARALVKTTAVEGAHAGAPLQETQSPALDVSLTEDVAMQDFVSPMPDVVVKAPHPPTPSPTQAERGGDSPAQGDEVVSPLPEGEGLGVRATLDFRLMRRMAGASWPLMLNHFLATIFFQIDVILIEAMHGATMVGQYQIAYKWITALNIIPAFFTQAMLPLLSRQATSDPDALRRNYMLAIKLLVSVALPAAVIFTFFAFPLTALLGGVQYLPEGAIATQLMIWSIPIGWMNSFTQYMLIAVDLQRRITWAFIVAVSFNLITNFLLIPQYGFYAAALTTIASEAILWVPFYWLLRGKIGTIPWAGMLWRPLAATAGMLAIMLIFSPLHPLIGLMAGVAVYILAWRFLNVLDSDEMGRLAPLLPGRLRSVMGMGSS
jgi:O-antigen/teichoic acid export membrane protein